MLSVYRRGVTGYETRPIPYHRASVPSGRAPFTRVGVSLHLASPPGNKPRGVVLDWFRERQYVLAHTQHQEEWSSSICRIFDSQFARKSYRSILSSFSKPLNKGNRFSSMYVIANTSWSYAGYHLKARGPTGVGSTVNRTAV